MPLQVLFNVKHLAALITGKFLRLDVRLLVCLQISSVRKARAALITMEADTFVLIEDMRLQAKLGFARVGTLVTIEPDP